MNAMQITGLVTLGFILGIVVSGLNFSPDQISGNDAIAADELKLLNWVGESQTFSSADVSGRWRLLGTKSSQGSAIAIAVDNEIRVVVQDDGHSSYYTVYDGNSDSWQGRLVDFGNDGSIEVADISDGHCEQFDSFQK